MSSLAERNEGTAAATAPAVQSPWRRFAADFAESRLALLGLGLLVVLISVALLAPVISPQIPGAASSP